MAFANHVEVAHLKNPQWQQTSGQQHAAQREQGKAGQLEGVRHGENAFKNALFGILLQVGRKSCRKVPVIFKTANFRYVLA
jgi:hypothetical protein